MHEGGRFSVRLAGRGNDVAGLLDRIGDHIREPLMQCATLCRRGRVEHTSGDQWMCERERAGVLGEQSRSLGLDEPLVGVGV